MAQLADDIEAKLVRLNLDRCVTAQVIAQYLRQGDLQSAQIKFETDGDKLIQYHELNEWLSSQPMLKDFYRYR